MTSSASGGIYKSWGSSVTGLPCTNANGISFCMELCSPLVSVLVSVLGNVRSCNSRVLATGSLSRHHRAGALLPVRWSSQSASSVRVGSSRHQQTGQFDHIPHHINLHCPGFFLQ